ncbi:alpha-hydroxyketone-type quorum-sensing autoinducer synthase [Caenimonas terrae]|uniref:Alpha-hydroxyketone-type quorum-sensing autoinducer synthase n=1 Tax=Caenimonas terrae TaxID=696074 RepID=A0ABW0NMV8_9BURK
MEVLHKPVSASAARRPILSARLQQRIETQFSARLRDEWGGRFVTHGKSPDTNDVRLDGNDYLAITGHPEIVQAQLSSLRSDREFVLQSGVFQLEGNSAWQLERAFCDWLGVEDGLLCQSGYTANLGLLQVVADADTPVYMDSLAHMSLWEGARAANAPVHAFRHNDPAHLAKVMARHGPGLVVVDSVYSTTGALCPLVQIVEAAEAAGSMILVDESHSVGTHGPAGAGLCAQLGLTSRVQFITCSLAKAFAGRAGFFSMPAQLRNYLMCHSFPSIFSSCLLPHEVAGLRATLEVVKRSDDARRKLFANTLRLRGSLSDAGYPIHQGSEQIISLEAGLELDTLALRDALEAQGVIGSVFCAPATSRNRAMVRLTLNAGLTEAELSHVESAARVVAAKVKPWEWPIARRNRAQPA